MRSVTFLLSKHPWDHHDGETAVSRLLLQAAAQSFAVRGIALAPAPGPDTPIPIEVVSKPPLSLARVLPRSLLHRRSAIHERFCPPALVAASARVEADRLVARRLYMAEAALAAERSPDAVVEVLESDVLRRRGRALAPVYALEARRTAADERRCMRASRSLVCFGDEEGAAARAATGRDVPRIELALPPSDDRPVALDGPPRALFLGDRRWAPNAAGLKRCYALWPAIRAGAPAAELLVVGVSGPGEPAPPAGVQVAGFVGDLDPVWGASRVLLAPIPIGGGVRVKVLESASRGIPVVGSASAVGATADYLSLAPVDDDAAFVAEAVRLLVDPHAARAAGERLWQANAEHVRSGAVERAVATWLGDSVPPEPQ